MSHKTLQTTDFKCNNFFLCLTDFDSINIIHIIPNDILLEHFYLSANMVTNVWFAASNILRRTIRQLLYRKHFRVICELYGPSWKITVLELNGSQRSVWLYIVCQNRFHSRTIYFSGPFIFEAHRWYIIYKEYSKLTAFSYLASSIEWTLLCIQQCLFALTS